MEQFEIYSDISARTNGDIYVGVVGPVRTGKSTFIKKFMDKVVLGTIADTADKQRMIDELPQSASGKMIMTTQPKFVPNKAVDVDFNGLTAKFRLVDCVGYFVSGAEGNTTDGGAVRMVKTPWDAQEMPLEKAAEIGTQKVIKDHSTIAVMLTTDGTFGDIGRLNYVSAEEKAIKELKDAGKPFVIVLNSAKPDAPETINLASSLADKYNAPVCRVNVEKMTAEDIAQIMEKVLYEFPVRTININLPKWVRALPLSDELVAARNCFLLLKTMPNSAGLAWQI
jgi:stage IV sporulation protein A